MIYWLTSVAALIPVWVYADLTHGLYPQAALMAVYFLLSLYGIASWSRRPKGKE